VTPDARASWVDRLPASWQPYARLARFDRPIGAWLLYWPCAWGVALAGGSLWWALIFGIGAVAMRAAGCVYNDIVDRDLDAGVARTAARPIPSGAVSVGAARRWMVVLALVGFGVWLVLDPVAKLVALGSLALVAAYPFMKRIMWWPQAWLGLAFNWGALVAWAQVRGRLDWAAVLLWAAGIAWTLGYDTIYALQDIEDDAVVGVKSSARALGARVRLGVGLFYVACVLLLGWALWLRAHDWVTMAALVPLAAHFAWQVARLRRDDPAGALRLFRANRDAGALIAMACVVVGYTAL
jgi:4-hydroxybenzoate polyprenyltransferase